MINDTFAVLTSICGLGLIMSSITCCVWKTIFRCVLEQFCNFLYFFHFFLHEGGFSFLFSTCEHVFCLLYGTRLPWYLELFFLNKCAHILCIYIRNILKSTACRSGFNMQITLSLMENPKILVGRKVLNTVTGITSGLNPFLLLLTQ